MCPTLGAMSTATVVPEWTLPERIKKAREYAGLSREELAALLATHENTVANWERGDTHPTQRKVRAVAAACSVDGDWLWDGDLHATNAWKWSVNAEQAA